MDLYSLTTVDHNLNHKHRKIIFYAERILKGDTYMAKMAQHDSINFSWATILWLAFDNLCNVLKPGYYHLSLKVESLLFVTDIISCPYILLFCLRDRTHNCTYAHWHQVRVWAWSVPRGGPRTRVWWKIYNQNKCMRFSEKLFKKEERGAHSFFFHFFSFPLLA